MRIALFILSLTGVLLAAPIGAQVIYKWYDASGQPHFSDVPREGAEEIYVASPQVYTPVSVNRAVATSPEAPAKEDGKSSEPSYSNLSITSPSAEETIWNTGGTISVNLALQPALTAGHTIRLLLDGRQKQQLGPGVTSTQLSGVERGTHQLQAQVVTPGGQIVQSAPAVTFYYKQASVQNRFRQ